jgi:AhpD family alkylhydroperoxidase
VWAAIDGVIRTVPALDALDPVTSELVRLRVARAHHCRLCMSIRNRQALRAGADEATFDAVDRYRDGSLGPVATAALGLVDTVLWTPGRIEPGVVEAAQAHLSSDQQVEVVCDVARNALNKVAVALGADAPHVTEGVELYEIAPDGSLVYGLAPD